MTPIRHLGLDLGVTNLKWAVLEHADDAWSSIANGQVPTRSAGGPDVVVGQLASVGAQVIAVHPGVVSIGIGVPGLYDPDTGTTEFLVNMPGAWRGVPVAAPVQAALGLPTALINDARAFGLAELRLGAGRGVRSMIGLTLGTGIGGVIAIDGHVVQGYKGTAGELGHQVIDPDGPLCNCGTRGCVEAYCRAEQVAKVCGTDTVEQAVLAARAGDERALSGLAEVGRYLGIGIANAIVVLTPERVVLGGGVAGAGELLLAPIRQEIRRRVHVTAWQHVDVVLVELGTTAGAIGAAVHGAERAAA
ncbi:MAG: ROK family protein [Chloroflexi bacterium]|nr:ROK family protein [Chloroflexota bacterium]